MKTKTKKPSVFLSYIRKTVDKEMSLWDATPIDCHNEKHYQLLRKKYHNSIVQKLWKEHNIRQKENEIKHKKESKELFDFYGEDILDSNEKYPVPWMEKDPKFMSMAHKEKYLFPILNYIWEIASYTHTKELQELLTNVEQATIKETMKTTGKRVKRELILFSFDYQNAHEKIKLSIPRIKRYLQRLVDFGVIRIIGGGRGTKHNRIYAYGTWIRGHEIRLRRNPFLKEETHKKSLHDFSLKSAIN
jgi:hypothetical protein